MLVFISSQAAVMKQGSEQNMFDLDVAALCEAEAEEYAPEAPTDDHEAYCLCDN